MENAFTRALALRGSSASLSSACATEVPAHHLATQSPVGIDTACSSAPHRIGRVAVVPRHTSRTARRCYFCHGKTGASLVKEFVGAASMCDQNTRTLQYQAARREKAFNYNVLESGRKCWPMAAG